MPTYRFNPTDSLLAREIAQQPDEWRSTLDRVLPFQKVLLADQSATVLCGAGTSAYAGSAIAEAWPGALAIPTTDILLQSEREILAQSPEFAGGGLLISLARSGDSPESAGVVERIQRMFPRVRHLAIVCSKDGRLAKMKGVNPLLLDPRTNDRSLAMTGSFSNLALAGLALRHRDQLAGNLERICTRVDLTLANSTNTLAQVAEACTDRVVVLASAMQALAREAALKFVELTNGQIMTSWESYLSFRHGPLGMLRENTPVVCLLSSDPLKRRYEYDLIADLRAKGLGRLLLVGDDPSIATDRDWYMPAAAPELPDHLRTPFEIVLLQMLAYQLAIRVGVDPDDPCPDGAVTRVVRPFRLHVEMEATA